MAEPATKKKTSSSSMLPDWTKLPEELLQVITEKMDNCFDVVHARSVCSSWRSTFPFPSCLSIPSYSLPEFNAATLENNEGFLTLKKTPLFLFRVRRTLDAPASASEFFLGRLGQDESEDQIELPSPLQCTVKVKMGESDPALMNMLDCQILYLGYQYRIFGWEPKDYRDAAFLPLNKEGGGEFVVLLNCSKFLLVFTSAEMRWKRLENVPKELCWELVTFRGRFYASFRGEIAVIDPYSLDVTHLMPPQPLKVPYLVPSGNDELFLVETFWSSLTLRVSRLDEEAGKWVEVTDLGDRVFFIGFLGNLSCSGKELPDGCGVSKNSILLTHWLHDPVFSSKYDGLNGGRDFSRNSVKILNRFPVVALRFEH